MNDSENEIDKNYFDLNAVVPSSYQGKFESEFKFAYSLIEKYEFSEALEKYIQLGEQGDVDSQFNAGMLQLDHGTLTDLVQAGFWFKKASNNGSIRATGALGTVYRKIEEYEKAIHFLGKAAESGDVDALIDLAYMYSDGVGVQENTSYAIKLTEQAAEISPDNSMVQENLAGFYGAEENFDKARVAADKALELGSNFFFKERYKHYAYQSAENRLSAFASGQNIHSSSPSEPSGFKAAREFWREYTIRSSSKGAVNYIDTEVASYEMMREGELSSMRERNRPSSGCFIATAVYHNYDAPEVKLLRKFRDEKLLTTRSGSIFVDVYYKYSPSIARFLIQNPRYKTPIKFLLLTPMVNHLKKDKQHNKER